MLERFDSLAIKSILDCGANRFQGAAQRGRLVELVGRLGLDPSSRSAEPPPQPGDATLGASPPAGASVLLGGERLEGWVQSDGKTPAKWPFADGILTVGHGDVMTDKAFGNFEIHVEFNVPYMPNANVQARGNSGVYLTGNYELQVLDSYGLKMQGNDCGAIYDQITPAVNACKPPLQGQTYDVTFHKAKLDNGKVVKKARVTVIQNGIKIIDNAEISPSPGARKLPRVRMVRSCSRTTAIRFSIGIFGSSRSSEQPRDDLTNTFVVGDEPTPRKIELYEICMGALAAGESLLRPDCRQRR
ncbi:MAG: family 16 glycoside hydrolase [Isosphaeraceae bacterium]